jgi:hypothetical protein
MLPNRSNLDLVAQERSIVTLQGENYLSRIVSLWVYSVGLVSALSKGFARQLCKAVTAVDATIGLLRPGIPGKVYP